MAVLSTAAIAAVVAMAVLLAVLVAAAKHNDRRQVVDLMEASMTGVCILFMVACGTLNAEMFIAVACVAGLCSAAGVVCLMFPQLLTRIETATTGIEEPLIDA